MLPIESFKTMNWMGLDIGGANIKSAWPNHADEKGGRALEIPFPMWTDFNRLDEALAKLLTNAGADDAVAVTMTGELADGFENREQGVNQIADSVARVCSGRTVAYYRNDGVWVEQADVAKNWDAIAAANWHATARWGSRFLPNHSGLVIDVGSTTSDFSPVIHGAVKTEGGNDLIRSINGELLYAGAGRTPVCGLIQEVIFEGNRIPIANELFATTTDVLLWLDRAAEVTAVPSVGNVGTADGRPKTRLHAGQRLARMVCRDLRDIPTALVDSIAEQAFDRLTGQIREKIAAQITKHGRPLSTALVVGEGGGIAEHVLKHDFPTIERKLLSTILTTPASVCGPAYAVATLAKEEIS